MEKEKVTKDQGTEADESGYSEKQIDLTIDQPKMNLQQVAVFQSKTKVIWSKKQKMSLQKTQK